MRLVSKRLTRGVGAVAIGLVLGASLGIAAGAQTPAHVKTLPRFEVVAIRPAGPSQMTMGTIHGLGAVDPTRWRVKALTLNTIIASAYGFYLYDYQRVIGLPGWALKTVYDIDAEMPPRTLAAQIPLMVRAMLEDRFKMVAKLETRPMRAVTLSVAPGGTKLTRDRACEAAGRPIPLDPLLAGGGRNALREPPAACGQANMSFANDVVTLRFHGLTMAELANRLSRPNLPVVDRAGIKGAYDFTVRYRGLNGTDLRGLPETEVQAREAEAGQWEEDAYRSQIGLVFDRERAKKLPVPVVVVEHIEPPSPN